MPTSLRGPPTGRVYAIVALVIGLLAVVGLAGQRPAEAPRSISRATEAARSAEPGVPAFSHIFLVVLENKEFEEVVGNPSAPYLNSLAHEYGLAIQYYSIARRSLPNYLALLGGETFGLNEDCRTCYQAAPSLADQVEASGRSWKGYFESMPSSCYEGDSADGLYVQKHNPFVYFDGIRLDPARCGRSVPLTELADDLASNALPDLIWIGPNLRNSTHDAPLAEGDRWLAGLLPHLLQSSAFQDRGLLVMTFDEGESSAACCGLSKGGGRVATVVASPLGRRGFSSDIPHDHYSLLRTIEDAWGLKYLGHAGDPSTTNLAEFFAPVGTP